MIFDALHRPLRDLRISVTDRCNFRCTYCMPAEIFGANYSYLPLQDLLTYEEIAQVARIMVSLGVAKLRLTGGEPLLRRDIETLVRQLAAIDDVADIAMTTNGYFLPEKAQAIKNAGLRRVTVSLDTLDDTIFRTMSGGRAGVQAVLNGITAAENAGFTGIKINAVVRRGVNDHTIVDLARYCQAKGWIIRFIEYMDVGTRNDWKRDEVVAADGIRRMIDAVMPLEPIENNYSGEVAQRYRYRDGGGEIGLIASVTKPFCGGCTRLRLSPDGMLYTCLFATKGFDLRTPLRNGANDTELRQMIRQIWMERADRYSELRQELTGTARGEKVEMYHIGG